MQIFWSEIELRVTDVDGVLTGNEARARVEGDHPGYEPGQQIVSLRWRDRTVTGQLALTILRGDPRYRVTFRHNRNLQGRPSDDPEKYNAHHARREDQNTLQQAPPDYVIVGRGTAAIVNHTTLRQTDWGRRRVGRSRIVHIGFEDPWTHYNRHEMGQFPQLLGMPGYENRPDLTNEDPTEPRRSTEFANNTTQEVARLQNYLQARQQDFVAIGACVALIQPRGVTISDDLINKLVTEGLDLDAVAEMLEVVHPPDSGALRLLLVAPDRTLTWHYACHIDICTGAGKPRSVDLNMVDRTTYEAMRTRIWEPPESWDDEKRQRSIMTGTEALYTVSDWSGEQRYCVMGSGGVAVNMVERARDSTDRKWIDWLATGTLHGSFPIARNDILLRTPHTWDDDQITAEGQQMPMGGFDAGRSDQLVTVDPAHKRWRFGQGSDIERATIANQTVTVRFRESRRNRTYTQTPSDPARRGTNIDSMIRDWWEQDSPLADGAFVFSARARQAAPPDTPKYANTPGRYDRLIRASGQDIRDVGQAETVAAHFDFEPITAPSDGRMVGLQTADGVVRVLGAAGTGNANLVNRDLIACGKMRSFHNSLPVQGQIMFVGFVFSGLNVATANHYFDPSNRKKQSDQDEQATTPIEVNTNLNTMSEAELHALLQDPSLSRKIIAVRCIKQEGFMSVDELGDAVEALTERSQQAPRVELLAHGWQKDLRMLQLSEVDSLDPRVINKKTQYQRLTDWIIHVRTQRGAPYPTKEALIADLEKRWWAETTRRDYATPLSPNWRTTLAPLSPFYRTADPFAF